MAREILVHEAEPFSPVTNRTMKITRKCADIFNLHSGFFFLLNMFLVARCCLPGVSNTGVNEVSELGVDKFGKSWRKFEAM